MFCLLVNVETANQKLNFVCSILRGAKDQAPNTMDMDTQPQGQQAAVPVFQPQVDFTHRHTHVHGQLGLWSGMTHEVR